MEAHDDALRGHIFVELMLSLHKSERWSPQKEQEGTLGFSRDGLGRQWLVWEKDSRIRELSNRMVALASKGRSEKFLFTLVFLSCAILAKSTHPVTALSPAPKPQQHL